MRNVVGDAFVPGAEQVNRAGRAHQHTGWAKRPGPGHPQLRRAGDVADVGLPAEDQHIEIVTAVLDVARAGVTAADLGRAATRANGGSRPWLPHFYLGHGIGVNAAEMPMIGTDLGAEFDEKFVLQSGMVLVLEPVVWEDGTGGYRSEEVLVITDDGWIKLTDYPYDPYGN